MGTSATIIAKTSDGRFGVTYVNYDGYISGVGKMLFEHYQDQSKIDAMLLPGHMSSLDVSPLCPEGHTYNTPVRGYSIYYGRDRGEDDVETDYVRSFDEAYETSKSYGGSYLYIWDGQTWWSDRKSQTLESVIKRGDD